MERDYSWNSAHDDLHCSDDLLNNGWGCDPDKVKKVYLSRLFKNVFSQLEKNGFCNIMPQFPRGNKEKER